MTDTIRKAVSATVPMSMLLRYGARFEMEDGSGGGSPGVIDEPDEEEGSEALDDEGAEDAFLKNLLGEGEEGEEPAADETHEEGDEEPAEPPKPQTKSTTPAVDDAEVEVKVGEETHKVKVGELKRLFGQEAALTRRSQEVAQARDAAIAEAEKARAVLTKALERANERFKPYSELNFLVLSKRMDEESLTQLMKDAREAQAEVQFLQGEMSRTVEAGQGLRAQADRETALAAVETLKADFPKTFGEEWSDALYADLLSFADKHGLKNARGVVDPAAIKLMRMAQLYEKGKTAAKEKVSKVATQPKKPLRSGGSPDTSRDSSGRFDGAMARLKRSGSAEDAEAAFLARMR